MSPFAFYLRDLRVKRKLLQKDAAEILGYEQSYLSALENSGKGTPKKSFIDRLIQKYALNTDEQLKLQLVLDQSKRRILLPLSADIAEYEIFHQLEEQLGSLKPQQIDLIKIALNLNGSNYQLNYMQTSEKESEESKM